MAEWILMSSLLIVIVLAVRALFRGRMGLRLRYAPVSYTHLTLPTKA